MKQSNKMKFIVTSIIALIYLHALCIAMTKIRPTTLTTANNLRGMSTIPLVPYNSEYINTLPQNPINLSTRPVISTYQYPINSNPNISNISNLDKKQLFNNAIQAIDREDQEKTVSTQIKPVNGFGSRLLYGNGNFSKESQRNFSSVSNKSQVRGRIGSYYPLSSELLLRLPDSAITSRSCNLPMSMFDIQRIYDDRMSAVFNDPSLRSYEERQFFYTKVEKEFEESYKAQEPRILQEIFDYNVTRIPLLNEIILTINQQPLYLHYKKIYQNYIDEPSCARYYELAKCINGLELEMEFKIDARSYVLDYVKKNAKDKFFVKEVKFDARPDFVQHEGCSARAAYDPRAGIIYMYNDFFRLTPTEQAFTLIHEIKHSNQNINPLFISRHLETDADQYSIEQCNCPICLKIMAIVCRARNDIEQLGYLGRHDYADAAKTATNVCKAHSQNDSAMKGLIEGLNKDDYLDQLRAVWNFDFEIGTMFDRLPTL